MWPVVLLYTITTADGDEPCGVQVKRVLHLEHDVVELVVRLAVTLYADVVFGCEHARIGARDEADGQRKQC